MLRVPRCPVNSCHRAPCIPYWATVTPHKETEQLAPLLLRVSGACHVMGISRSELYRLMAAGELRSILIGPRQRRIPVAEIHAYVARKLAGETRAPHTA